MMRLFVAVVVLAGAAAALPSCSSKSGDPAPAYAALDEMLDPQTCNQCHTTHYSDWSGSMHAYASDDPVFLAMNQRAQRETNGAIGSFCVNCHAPMAVRQGATTDGLNLASVPQKLKGVTCYFCHSVDSVGGSSDDPLHLASDLVMRGPFPQPGTTDPGPAPNNVHASEYSQLHDRAQASSASMCGSCHDVTDNIGAHVERTFAEWQASVYSTPNGDTCDECHMPRSTKLEAVANYPGVSARYLHAHNFPAVDQALTPGFPNAAAQTAAGQALLDTTLQSAVCVDQRTPTQASLRVIIDNVAAGHGFPSGAAQDRRFWVEVIASQAGNVVYQSGVVADGANPLMSPDPDMWMLRDCIFDQTGNPVTMFWQEASFDGNELPPQLTFDQTDPRFYQTHVYQRFPPGNDFFTGAPDKVTVRFRLQPIGQDVLQDLVSTGDLQASIAAAMPTLEVGSNMNLTWTTGETLTYYEDDVYPLTCATNTNFNVAADKVLATPHTRCSP